METVKITRKTVTDELTRSIQMWLDLASKKNEEFKNYKGLDYDAQNCQLLSFTYHSMAHSLYLSGRTLGIVFDDSIKANFSK